MTALVGIGNGTRTALLGAAGLALLGAAAASLAVGALQVPLGQVMAALTGSDGSDAHVVVTELRVPRTALGLLVGGALGAAGALMQGATRNPLAEPGILGINAGAAFAVVVAIKFLGIGTAAGYMAFALLGAGVSAVLVFALGMTGRGASAVSLALAGSVLAAFFISLTSAVLVLDSQTLDAFRFWIVGSIAGRDAGVALAVAPIIG